MSDAPYFFICRNLKKQREFAIKELIANLFFNHQKLTHV